MKKTLRNLPLLVALFCAQGLAQEVRIPPVSTTVAIPESMEDPTPLGSAVAQEKPEFRIESTQVKLIDVAESPPMPGLPPVEGTMTLKVHSVSDPGLPDPPQSLPPTHAEQSELRERFSEFAGNHQETLIAFVSATVYDHSRTLLTCYPNGGGNKAVTVWSNIDFNHFSGTATFEATGTDGKVRSYQLMMGIGNETTEGRRELLAERNIDWETPEIPKIPDGAPAFVMVTEDSDAESLKLIEDLHALYRDEGTKMAAAAAAQKQAYEDKKAYLLANPPIPKDITVHFWKREDSATQPEGEQP